MSIYQKFIDSARKQEDHSKTMRRQTTRENPTSLQKLVQMQPSIGSTISSTPVSKRQYRRLIESGTEFNSIAHGRNGANKVLFNQIPKQQEYPIQLRSHYEASPLQQQSMQQRLNINIQQTCSPNSNRVRSNVEFSYDNQAQAHHRANCASGQQQREASSKKPEAKVQVNDPVLLKWMQAMRFETELECLTALQARTLAIDEHSAGALSVRNSQVAIHEMRLESQFIIDLIDHLIGLLPVNYNSIEDFSVKFMELWDRLTQQTNTTLSNATNSCQVSTSTGGGHYVNVPNGVGQHCQLTIINRTPRKSAVANARTLKPLDQLAIRIRNVCLEFSQMINNYQDQCSTAATLSLANELDQGQLEANLRRIKEYYGKFVEISLRAEGANIVRALDYDFSNSALNRLSSNASLKPVRPYESSCAQLPLKWALIALWQLTKEDYYICRVLTEKWQTATTTASTSSTSSPEIAEIKSNAMNENVRPRAARQLDYSTKFDEKDGRASESSSSLRSDYEKLYQICQNNEEFRRKQEHLDRISPQKPSRGALSSAMKSKQERSFKQISTIELLIDIIISQPNKHERIDVMNFIHSEANKLIDFEHLDQSISAAIYTSNQYKVAALRILNHLCVNDQAIKTILKCFSTPPPNSNRQTEFRPENKIIKSIFECYQTAQEHIYQNDTILQPASARRRQLASSSSSRGHKRSRQLQRAESGGSDEFSDYGSRQTNSGKSNGSHFGLELDAAAQSQNQYQDEDDGDDAVIREAIRLLIQLTSPFHRSNQAHDYYTLIGQYSIDSLVRYLTNIMKSTQNRELLLLSMSALANISFITTDPMKSHGTTRIILEIFRASRVSSKDLELRDQAVTVMANAADKNLMDIVNNGGLTFLLSCLEVCPTRMSNYKQQLQQHHQRFGSSSSASDELDHGADYRSLHEYAEVILGDTCSLSSTNSRGYHTIAESKSRDRKPIVLGAGDDVGDLLDNVLECACDHQQSRYSSGVTSVCSSRLSLSELAAMERIHQKTAVAFARMSADPITTRMVLKYGGVKQMIDLCKYDYKRNFSDTVLIACIAALRKISNVIGRDIFRNYNALDLIELDPKSALKIYGNPRDSLGSRELLASEV